MGGFCQTQTTLPSHIVVREQYGREVFVLAETKKVILDAGHGGTTDPGAVYQGRQEKNDNLRMALAVGQILNDHGVDVGYTRVQDVYQSPLQKAQMANNWDADYFVSFHRNAMPVPGTASGTESLIFSKGGEAERLAANINTELRQVGWNDLGSIERPGLIVLRKTEMPAVLVEVGFLDNEADNQRFDECFEHTAQAIAGGILTTLRSPEGQQEYYQIQVGAYAEKDLAQGLLSQLQAAGYPAFLVYQDGLYKVRVGAYLNLDNAAWMEKTLRTAGYSTLLVKEPAVY